MSMHTTEAPYAVPIQISHPTQPQLSHSIHTIPQLLPRFLIRPFQLESAPGQPVSRKSSKGLGRDLIKAHV